MKVEIELDASLTPAQRQRIESLFASFGVADPVQAFCGAAISEFADTLLSRPPESATQTPQRRLYHVMKVALNGSIPSEEFVGRLFGITERRALTLITNVTKRYDEEFRPGYVNAVSAALKERKPVGNEGLLFRFNAPQIVVNFMKDVVDNLESGSLTQIERVKGSAQLYEISSDTLRELAAALKLKLDA